MRIVLVTTLIALLAASITGVLCIDWIRSSSEKALTQQLESNLKNIVQQKVVSADAQLEHYEKYIEFVTDYIEQMYENEDQMIEQGRIFDPPRDTKEYMLTRLFANESVTMEKVEDEVLFFSNLEQVWEPIAKENEDLITTVYAGTKNGLLTSYDRWSYLSAVPEGEELYYDYFESGWYKQGMKEKGIFFTSLYVDSQGRGLTITIASPFHDASGKVVGVDCADFDITGLYDELLAIDLGDGTFSFALDQDGKIISPDADNKSFGEATGLTAKEFATLKADEDGIMETRDAVYVGIPIVLVIAQPDFGTALVYVAVFSVMVFVSGTNSKLIWGVIGVLVVLMIPLWYFMNNSGTDNFRFTRILMWLNPEAYPDEARQIINGQIAIGSGGVFGKGIVSPGSFASLGYISDDHTDFIFAIVCESFGLVGGVALVLGYVLLIGRLIVLSVRVKDPYGSYLIVGVMAMLLFHVVENIGMVIGLLPVTGIPLPFVSYGGSNMLTNMMGIGLVLNVVMRSRQHEQRQHTSNAKVVELKRE